ncbi:protein of unknown function [Micropruina glycogenica]|uniref:Uncharacterized protein n=1 Tax=Micropruina glycogenica TaxID=75385 RepID=A0A2N9JJX4_9ACTN|nr:protein of unknown function [Micropruina glycogenica]
MDQPNTASVGNGDGSDYRSHRVLAVVGDGSDYRSRLDDAAALHLPGHWAACLGGTFTIYRSAGAQSL